MTAYTARGDRIAYEGPYPARISESLDRALGLMCRLRVTKWKLTNSELDDLELVTGQDQRLLGVPVLLAPGERIWRLDQDASEATRDRLIAYNRACYLHGICSLEDFEHAVEMILHGSPAPNGGWTSTDAAVEVP